MTLQSTTLLAPEAPEVTADRWAEARAVLRAGDPRMAALVDARPLLDPDAFFDDWPSELWSALVAQVLGQQISLAAAAAIRGRLQALCGGRLPTPVELLAIDEGTLRDVGLSRAKAVYLYDLAARLVDGRLDLARLRELHDDAARDELTQIKGVGRFTADGTADPMLPLGLFRRPDFTWGNVETLLIYGGLGLLFFVLVVFLQQTAGYTALETGAATIPTTVLLFLLAKPFGALADRHGPRVFMAAGPLVSAGGVVYLLAMVDETPSFARDVLPGTTIFALGLAIVVAPLTAAILADADESTAGIASGINNAVARVGGLLATAAVGTVAGGALDIGGFRMALAAVAALLALGGAIGIWRIPNPRRQVAASRCAAGQLAGAPSAIGDVPAVELDLALRDPQLVGHPLNRARP
jgi:hypothetical protein